MSGHALDGGGVEQVGVVGEQGGEAVLAFDEGQGQVEFGRAGSQLEGADLQAGQLRGDKRPVLEDKEHLEEGRMAHIPGRLQIGHELLEGQFLVFVGSQGHGAHLRQQLAEGGVAGEIGAQHEGIGEEADEVLGFGLAAAGDGGADDDVLLAGVAVEQGLEGGQEGHEGGDAGGAAQRPDGIGQGFGQREAPPLAVVGLHRRAGAVSGQLQNRRRAGQLLPPVGHFLFQEGPLQRLPLPGGVVGVLDGQLGQRRGLAGGKGRVEGCQLAQQHADGPAVGDDVVQGQDQDVVTGGQPEQDGPEEGAAGEIEGAQHFLGGDAAGFGLSLLRGQVIEGHNRQRELARRANDLDGPAVHLAEGGAQRFVALHDLVQAALQYRHIQRPTQAEGHFRHVVQGAVRLQPFQKPHALLGKRQREYKSVLIHYVLFHYHFRSRDSCRFQVSGSTDSIVRFRRRAVLTRNTLCKTPTLKKSAWFTWARKLVYTFRHG